MQRYAAMILALLLALTTAGCMAPAAQEMQEHAGNEAALETPEATAGNGWGITLSAKDVTPTGLTLVIAQSGGAPSGTLQFGSSFQLSVLVDGVWSDVPYTVDADSVAWTAEAYIVAMEDSAEYSITWEAIYGVLPAGTYRICKEFQDFRAPGDYDTESCWAEFEII